MSNAAKKREASRGAESGAESKQPSNAARCQKCGSTVDSFGFCRCEGGPTFTEAEADAKLIGHDRHVVATIGRAVIVLQERGWAVSDIETAVEQHLSAAYDREEAAE